MSKTKKIIISIIITLAGIFGFSTAVNAYYVGQYVDVSLNTYLNNGNIFCVEHEQALTANNSYRIISQVKIEGNKSTDYQGNEQVSWYNAKLAYILSANNGSNKNSGPVANSVWNYMYTWLQNVGKYHAGLYSGFSNGVQGTYSWLDTESTNYANNLGDTTKITDNTNKDNIKVVAYEKDGVSYTRVGPFNWTFSGSMKDIVVNDQDGNKINDILISSFSGNEEYWYGANNIKSEKDFYISIPAELKVSKITKITGYANATLKGVNIWFLESLYGYKQNLIIREPYEAPQEIVTEFDYDIQLTVKLSGFVWLDKPDGKRAERNDLFKDTKTPDRLTEGAFLPDTTDILFDGIIVRLKDRTTGEVIKETVTSELNRYTEEGHNGHGEYLFEDILIGKLKDYYIEFEYDGLTYTNVIANIDKDNGSKASESADVRDEFNKNFSVIEGKTRNTGITKDSEGNEKHTLSYNINEVEYTATLINNGQYIIDANTEVTGYDIASHYISGQDEIRYINLGLYEREQPDLAIKKDLQNVRLTINGYEHVYEYAQRYVNQGEYGDGFNVGVKFGNPYSSMQYTRAIYKADYEYVNEKDKSKELQVFLTYRIGVSNKSSSLTAKINNIVDYYDTRYEIINAGNKLDEKGLVISDIDYSEPEQYNDEYKKVIINSNSTVVSSGVSEIYVQFKLNREAVLDILNDKENLNNVAEINSYSIYNNGNIYAGIDINSAPGNCVPEDRTTYEDDTDISPTLKLEVADAREMAGKVFLDETTGELMTGKVRQGSGAYEEGEKGIQGVEITLTENTGSEKVYTATTDENGDFLITGYIPGDYTLKYVWGDQTYTVQKYKGTVYDKSRDQNNKNWYKEDVDKRLSDAIDNYNTRLEIDEELKNIKNSSQVTKTKMDSTTPTMGIGVEYETTYTASTGDKYTYRIDNVDFGIVERARQDLALLKRVSAIKATLTNGQILADFTIAEDGTITGNRENVTYMAPNKNVNPENGFVRLELDNEIIQGTTLELEYSIKAVNQSELDYLSENFYKYGTIEGEVVKIEPIGVIDYLSKEWSVDEKNNDGWAIKNIDDIKEMVAENVYSKGNKDSTILEKIILYTENLKGTSLAPTESKETILKVSKVLSNSDEVLLDNETEIVELSKTGGAQIQSIPGNYVPGSGNTETDDHTAETVIVTPSTGENQNYLIIVVTIISALVILGVGVVIINKKVVKKD